MDARLLALLPCFAVFCSAQTQSPVLAWSARVGPELRSLTSALATPAGESVIIGGTGSADAPADIYVGKVSADGAVAVCGSTLGGAAGDLPTATAAAPNGDVFIAGTTDGAFPVTPGALLIEPEAPFSGFLARVAPCGDIRFATFLPRDLIPSALGAGPGGELFIAAKDRSDDKRTHLLRMDPDGRRILARIDWLGTAVALAVDPDGNLYVAGMRDRRAVITKFTASLARTPTDLVVGDQVLSMFTAIALAPDRSLWLAGAAIPPGLTPVNEGFYGGIPLPYSDNLAATLTHLDSAGTVILHRLIDLPDFGLRGASRRPVSLGLGPDGRVWVAIAGVSGFPVSLPVPLRTPITGVHLRSFDPSGRPTGGDTLIPGMERSGDLPAVAFSAEGRVVVARPHRHFPVTPGSADSQIPAAASIVAFELSRPGAPVTDVERALLDIDSYGLPGATITPGKSAAFSSTDSANIAFTAFVAPTGPLSSIAKVPFSTPDTSGTLPATIRVNTIEGELGDGILVLLAPGTQGLPAVPIRRRRFTAFWRVASLERLELPAPEAVTIRSTLRVEAIVSAIPGLPLPVSFKITSETPWLRLGRPDGTAPAAIPFEADLAGLRTGTSSARLRLDYEGASQVIPLSVTIGPLLRFDGLDTVVTLLAGETASLKFTILSSGTPLDFTLVPRDEWTRVSPVTGRTPQEISVISTPPSPRPGDLVNARIGYQSGNSSGELTIRFLITSPQPPALPDALSSTALSPGSVFRFLAGTSRCDASPSQFAPWPITLGGCTVRMNGRALPLGGITSSPLTIGTRAFQPVHEITAQLPYDVESGRVEIELEDGTGRRSVLPATVAALAPISLGVQGVGPSQPFARQPGETFVLRFQGLGVLAEGAPWGDLPTASLAPKAPIAIFVGARPARVLRAELSATDVGVVEIEVEVPLIAPDAHLISLRVGDQIIAAGPSQSGLLVITPPPAAAP